MPVVQIERFHDDPHVTPYQDALNCHPLWESRGRSCNSGGGENRFLSLFNDKIKRYFELGCKVKGLGRGHVKRIKDAVKK